MSTKLIWRVEQLLKFVEIPFVYSLLIIPISVDHTIVSDASKLIPFTLLLGIIAGVFSIVDPFGKLIKWRLVGYDFKKEKEDFCNEEYNSTKPGQYFNHKFMDTLKDQYLRHGININPMIVEINKVVAMFYFVFLSIVLMIILPEPSIKFF